MKNKKLLGLAVVIFLALLIPLLLWGFLTNKFDLRKRAGGGLVTPPNSIPLDWQTNSVRITADDFSIETDGKVFTGALSGIILTEEQSAVGNETRAKFTASYNKFRNNLKLEINFRTDNQTTWYVSSVRVYNRKYADKWVTYTNWPLETPLGEANHLSGEWNFALIDPYTNRKIVDVHFTNLSIQAFMDFNPSPSPTPLVANECEMCAGFAGIECASGLTCLMQAGNYPDQSGICVKTDGSSQCTVPSPTPEPTTTPSPEPIPGDVNQDGHVNIVDVGIVIDNYKMTNPDDPRADINNDGFVNIVDIGIIIDNYGR